jgi:hypothetical protein
VRIPLMLLPCAVRREALAALSALVSNWVHIPPTRLPCAGRREVLAASSALVHHLWDD